MTNTSAIPTVRISIAALALAAVSTLPLFAQSKTTQKKEAAPEEKKVLVVNGKTVPGSIVQMDGHSYVDLESFAQAVNGTVAFDGNNILLNLPSSAAAPATAETPATKTPVGLSREFSQLAIASVSDMREWRGAIASTLRFGVASGNWLGPFLADYQTRAQRSLDQAALAAKSDSDRKAYDLLRSEFANVQQWDSQTQSTIQSLNAEPAVNPSATANDPLRIKIADCSAFLNSMLVSGTFEDNSACH